MVRKTENQQQQQPEEAHTASAEHYHSTSEERDSMAQEHFGKPYDQLDTHQKRAVGGYIGTQHRKEHMGGGHNQQQAAEMKAAEEPQASEESHQGTTSEERDSMAQEHFGKPYDQLDTHQRRAVGGFIGAKHRKEHMGQ